MILKLENYDSKDISFIVEHNGKRVDRVWYANPYDKFPSFETLDFAVVGYIMKAMRLNRELIIKGPVYEQTLNNIMDYQKQINEWWPQYNVVDIGATVVKETPPNNNKKYMTSFTAGVDSTFTSINRRNELDSLLYIAGCDISLNYKKELENVRQTIIKLFKDTGIKLEYIESNIKGVVGDHDRTHACQILSVAWLFASLNRGFIMSGGSVPPDYPWGTSALSNPFLGNDYFEILYEPYIDRTQKIKIIYEEWPEAYDTLRVCWENTRRSHRADENCCECVKCIRALLSFKVLGLKKPDSFKRDVDVVDVMKLKQPKYAHERLYLKCLYENVEKYNKTDMEIFKKVKEILDAVS